MNHDLPQIPTPHCPHCYSRNLVPLSRETLINASIGAGIGAALTAAGILAQKRNRNSLGIPGIVTGALSGAMAGVLFSAGEGDGKMTQTFVCLHCYHRFQWLRGANS